MVTGLSAPLQGLAKYAFGLGTLQMTLCILAFSLFALPVGHGIGTEILIRIFHAPPRLAAIRSVDEAVVIAAALSLSSSAFVLQLLSERGELATRFGSATLGILLLQVGKRLQRAWCCGGLSARQLVPEGVGPTGHCRAT